MFFSISTKVQDNYPSHFYHNNIVINTDSGWQTKTITSKVIVYKGYADLYPLDEILEEIISQNEPSFTGNFCVFVLDKNEIHIKTDLYRSFPIHYSDSEITNLYKLSNFVSADKTITINNDLKISEKKFNIIGDIDDSLLSYDDVIFSLNEILSEKISKFFTHNTLPVKTFLSGGIDSMVVYSYTQKYTNTEILSYEHLDFDLFYLKNSYHIQKLWAYRQIHHWREPTLLCSGAPGDEFMLRSPVTANFYCIHNNTSIPDLLNEQKYKDALHHSYFSKPNHLEIFNNQIQNNNKLLKSNKKYLINTICNEILNDYQHHHLGNTLTFTPLRDLRLMKLMLRLQLEDAYDQIMDSKVSKKLIELNNKDLLNFISTKKNSYNYMENLIGLII